ncbi:hypothetical protein C7S16_4436 [Burkholderia thailandensis]|uniref:Uncharacterized protein n=1 Tax=Burkholderia thailandensis TaxID=57975 RepID=A0AAW9CQI8_BURTH|nr:hypothetical protein [Burkholderia thailandensis]
MRWARGAGAEPPSPHSGGFAQTRCVWAFFDARVAAHACYEWAAAGIPWM